MDCNPYLPATQHDNPMAWHVWMRAMAASPGAGFGPTWAYEDANVFAFMMARADGSHAPLKAPGTSRADFMHRRPFAFLRPAFTGAR